MTIIIDTREQNPLKFPANFYAYKNNKVSRETLNLGDYGCVFEDGTDPRLVFERKSKSDLWGTLANKDNHDRMREKYRRSVDYSLKMVFIIEESLNSIRKGFNRSSYAGDSMIYQLFTIRQSWGMEIVFCDGREEMATYILETFNALGRQNWEKTRPRRKRRDTGD